MHVLELEYKALKSSLLHQQKYYKFALIVQWMFSFLACIWFELKSGLLMLFKNNGYESDILQQGILYVVHTDGAWLLCSTEPVIMNWFERVALALSTFYIGTFNAFNLRTTYVRKRINEQIPHNDACPPKEKTGFIILIK